jgi:hypothetical protein
MDEVELGVPGLGTGPIAGIDDPPGARPLAAVEIRLLLGAPFGWTDESGVGTGPAGCDVAASPDGPATGTSTGRFVSFRWGLRAGATVVRGADGAALLSVSLLSGDWRWMRLWRTGVSRGSATDGREVIEKRMSAAETQVQSERRKR